MKSWGEKPYHSLDYELKQRFGEKIYKLTLNGGMSCPNRDGKISYGGCIFCSEGGSGEFASSAKLSIPEQIRDAKKRLSGKRPVNQYIAYFQAYTNTYAPISHLRRIYTEALNEPDVVALSIGTRCDCLNDEVLNLLEELAHIKPIWIELGLQTIHNQTHARLNTLTTVELFDEAVDKLHARNIPVITHVILGLPGETKEMMLETISHIASLPVSGIKLQLLHILKGTKLAFEYETEPFPVFELEGCRGRRITVFRDRCIIKTDATLGAILTDNATDGAKTIFYKDVIGIQYKEPGFVLGYLQLETGSNQMNNSKSNMFSENTYTFDKNKELVEEIRDYITYQVSLHKQL